MLLTDETLCQGWRQNSLHDHTVNSHGASFNGYRSFVAFVPAIQAGVIVFTNLHWTEGSNAAGMVALDHLLGVDAVEERLAQFQKRAQ